MRNKKNKLKLIIGSVISILIILGILVCWFIGMKMPSTFVVWDSMEYDNTPEEIWSFIATFENNDKWRSDVDDVKIIKYTENKMPIIVYKHGISKKYFEVVHMRTFQQLQFIEVKSDLIQKIRSYNIEIYEENNKTNVSITLHEEQINPFKKIKQRLVQNTNIKLHLYLVDLKKGLQNKFSE